MTTKYFIRHDGRVDSECLVDEPANPDGLDIVEHDNLEGNSFDYVRQGSALVYSPEVLPPEQLIAQYEAALDQHLDSIAQGHRFKDRHALSLRAAYPNAWQALGGAFGTWMDDCNVQAYALLQEVLDGVTPMPTIPDFLAGLPQFVAP